MVKVNTEYVMRLNEEEARFIMTLLYCHVTGSGENRAISDRISEALFGSGLTSPVSFPSFNKVDVTE